MKSANWSTENLVRILIGVLGVTLSWQGRAILARIDRIEVNVRTLERNQVKILTTFGVQPCAVDTLENRVKTRVCPPLMGNHGNQKNQTTGKAWTFCPGHSEGIMVVNDCLE